MKITLEQARKFLTFLHFEDERIPRNAGVQAQIDAIVRRMGSVQYDPLDVVGRNADLVLQSRIDGYKTEYLWNALYEARTLFEGFDKCLCIYPAEDFPVFTRTRVLDAWHQISDEVRARFPEALAEIEEKGAICSDDLASEKKVSWPWGPTRIARAVLESLWIEGTLALHHRKGTRRYYDLVERCLPADIVSAADPHPTDREYFAWQMYRRIRSVGMLTGGASYALIGVEMKAAERKQAIEDLLAAEKIFPVEIEGIKLKCYIAEKDREVLARAMSEIPAKKVRVIAPLDNLIWDRKLIEKLFGFYYTWEVYVPKAKRIYGYYVLPVMCGERFIGRFEPENFQSGRLKILNWWWETGVSPDEYRDAVKEGLDNFCKFLGADGWTIEREITVEE